MFTVKLVEPSLNILCFRLNVGIVIFDKSDYLLPDAVVETHTAQAEADANAKINSSITDQLIRMKEAEARLKHGWVTVQGSDTVVTKDADSDK